PPSYSSYAHTHPSSVPSSFIFNAPPTPEIYTLSLHDALPIYAVAPSLIETDMMKGQSSLVSRIPVGRFGTVEEVAQAVMLLVNKDRKSTRLNSSHVSISYAVFCLKKKKKK